MRVRRDRKSRADEDGRRVIEQIRQAFTTATYPGHDRLIRTGPGDEREPELLAAEFQGKTDWRVLPARLIDDAPDGFGSALCFFSHEAFRFYLPAYLIADLEGKLGRVDPVFHLTHGLCRASASEPINPALEGGQRWLDYALERFAAFTREAAAAIVAYLEQKWLEAAAWGGESTEIDDALERYWRERAR